MRVPAAAAGSLRGAGSSRCGRVMARALVGAGPLGGRGRPAGWPGTGWAGVGIRRIA